MESILCESAYVLSTLFKLYIISKFMNIFLGAATKEKSIIVAAYIFQLVACAVQYAYMPYVLLNIVNTDELVHTARSSSACFPVFQCTLSAA